MKAQIWPWTRDASLSSQGTSSTSIPTKRLLLTYQFLYEKLLVILSLFPHHDHLFENPIQYKIKSAFLTFQMLAIVLVLKDRTHPGMRLC